MALRFVANVTYSPRMTRNPLPISLRSEKRMKRRLAALAICLLLVLGEARAVPCWTLQGTVSDLQGRPLDASVSVEIGGSNFVQKADHHGNYSITNIPSNPHGCTLSVDGPTGFCYRGGFRILEKLRLLTRAETATKLDPPGERRPEACHTLPRRTDDEIGGDWLSCAPCDYFGSGRMPRAAAARSSIGGGCCDQGCRRRGRAIGGSSDRCPRKIPAQLPA